MSAFLDAIDPLRNAAFRDELPGVHAAFDETVMRRHLQAAANPLEQIVIPNPANLELSRRLRKSQ